MTTQQQKTINKYTEYKQKQSWIMRKIAQLIIEAESDVIDDVYIEYHRLGGLKYYTRIQDMESYAKEMHDKLFRY